MISDRIEAIIAHFCKGNKSLFAQQIGVRPSVIGNITGERKGNPSFEVIQKILNAFASINPDWFILNKGSMLRARDNQMPEEDKWSSTPVATPISHAEESIIYKMYEKKDEENKALIEELGGLKERIRTLESKIKEYENSEMFKERTADLTDAKDVSTKKPSSRHGSNAGSHGVL